MKTNIANLKNYIKELNVEQKADKLQRKTVHLPEGFKRTKEPWDAAQDVLNRREELRVLYHIYNKLRNRPEVHPEVESYWNYRRTEEKWMQNDSTSSAAAN